MADYFLDNSTAAQRNRLLDALLCGPITTIEARKNLDILMPAARVWELRNEGYQIETAWVWQVTDAERAHRVARYFLATREKGDE